VRNALLAGATGLIGQTLLQRLVADARCGRVEVLARRPLPGADAKLRLHVVDFAALPSLLPAVDDCYIALGTTIKVAGSEAAFRAVDFDAVVAVARAARQAGATRLAVVSSLGASRTSRIFYSRVKGDMEAAVGSLGYASVVIAQPSHLTGDRAALGQPVRSGEVWTLRLLGPVLRLLPRGVRPIAADDVAAALIAAVADARSGTRVLGSGEMQGVASRG